MDHECPLNVVGYDKSRGTQHRDLPTVSGVLAYDDPSSGVTIMLIVHQAISVTTMNNNLLCLQIWMNDIELNDTQNFLTENPTSKTHAISGLDQDSHEYIIPFTLRSVTTCIPTHKPSRKEFDTCPRIELTCELPEWDPHSETFKQQEEALLDNKGLVHDAPMPVKSRQSRQFISTLDNSETTTLFPHVDDLVHSLGIVLADNVNVSSICTSKDKHSKLNALDLAQRWGISIEKARRTIAKMTQHGLRSVLHPTLSQWYRTNDHQF